MIHRVDNPKRDIYSLARTLLAQGADPRDTLRTTYAGKPALSGTIGKLAEWALAEDGRLIAHKEMAE